MNRQNIIFNSLLRNPVSTVQVNYGRLYNWYAATDVRNIANTGWHVPSITEWETLMLYLDPDGVPNSYTNDAGTYLKETGTIYWDTPNTGATNTKLFNGRGAGMRNFSGVFVNYKQSAFFWSTTADPGIYTSKRADLFYDYPCLYIEKLGGYFRVTGGPVRLLKDSTTLTDGQAGTYTGNDGKVYRTICIGTQEWLADNLCETEYRNGDAIPEVTDNAAWAALTTGAWCAYDNDNTNVLG
jgi:uncharacterized protein (TIGR02145 family)